MGLDIFYEIKLQDDLKKIEDTWTSLEGAQNPIQPDTLFQFNIGMNTATTLTKEEGFIWLTQLYQTLEERLYGEVK